jgi:hypothetical protein
MYFTLRGVFLPGINRLEREASRSPVPLAAVGGKWSFTLTVFTFVLRFVGAWVNLYLSSVLLRLYFLS